MGVPPPCRYSHTPLLHNVHVVFGAGVVAVCTHCPPEVRPQPPLAGHQGGDDVPKEASTNLRRVPLATGSLGGDLAGRGKAEESASEPTSMPWGAA